MKEGTLSHISQRRGAMRGVAMNAALLALLSGVFLWSAAGNAFDNIRGAAKGLITPTQSR